jgi:predicted nucleotidyltransferase
MRTVDEHLLQEITRRLVELFHPEQVILFGSYAWGTPTAGSDVDVMVIVTESNLSDYQRALLARRCLSGLDIAKDVIVRTRAEFDFLRDVRASLEYKIARQGRVLYDRYPGLATEPDREQVEQALAAAEELYTFVVSLLPPEMRPE